MLTNIDLEKMNHLMETNKDAKEIIRRCEIFSVN